MFCFNCLSQNNEGSKFCVKCGKEILKEKAVHHLRVGTVLNNKYLVGNVIGEGGFGITYVGYDLNLEMKIAIKEFFPNGYANRNNTVSNTVTLNTQSGSEYFKNAKEHFMREAKNIAKFSKENGIVDVRDFFSENDTAYIIMEFLDGENLSDYLKRDGVFNPESIFKLMLPIMRSLEKMHNAGIVHRDISPDNIRLLDDGTLKLMDFGSARYFAGNEQKTMSVMLKPGYAPYEQYSPNGNQGPWTDVYSLCATIYKCITGKTPIDSLGRVREDILEKPSAINPKLSQSLENVLLYGLAVYTEDRCQNMQTLIAITEAALKNEPIQINIAPKPTVKDDIYKTTDANGSNKTVFADAPVAQIPIQNKSKNTNTPPPATQKTTPAKKSQAPKVLLIGIIAVILISLVVIFGVLIGAFIDSLINDSNSFGKKESSSSVIDDNTMIDVVNTEVNEAKRQLTKLGLTVIIKEEPNNHVADNHVISQSIEPNEKINKGDEVTLYVSTGFVQNPDSYDQKVVVTAASGSSSATLTLYEWSSGQWTERFSCPATVGAGGISAANSESNTLTPKGTFPLGVVLTSQNITTSMNVYRASVNTVICDDTSRPAYYNQIFERNQLPSSVHVDSLGQLLAAGHVNACIFIQHNGTGFSSNGVSIYNSSVITICGVNGSLSTTGGCIDITASNMLQLLSLLDADKQPHIVTEVR